MLQKLVLQEQSIIEDSRLSVLKYERIYGGNTGGKQMDSIETTKITEEKPEEQDKDTKQTLSDEDLDQVSGGMIIKPMTDKNERK